jgi:hypothetical protein
VAGEHGRQLDFLRIFHHKDFVLAAPRAGVIFRRQKYPGRIDNV